MPLPSRRAVWRFQPANSAPLPASAWRIPAGRCVSAGSAAGVLRQRGAICSSRLPGGSLPARAQAGTAAFRPHGPAPGCVVRVWHPVRGPQQAPAGYGGSVTDRIVFGGRVVGSPSCGGTVTDAILYGGSIADGVAFGGSITISITYGGTVRDPCG